MSVLVVEGLVIMMKDGLVIALQLNNIKSKLQADENINQPTTPATYPASINAWCICHLCVYLQ